MVTGQCFAMIENQVKGMDMDMAAQIKAANISAYWGRWWHRQEAVATTCVRATPKSGRNDPCPCGSGKKFKKCRGAAAAPP